MSYTYTAIVIGSGPAGHTAALRINQLWGKSLLIEKDLVGGICTNRGCTPSKAMITSSKYAKFAKHAAHYGVNVGEITVDFAQVAARRDAVMARSRTDIKHHLDTRGVELIQGTADIIDEHTVHVNGQNYTADNIIIATGSQPLVPAFLQKNDPSIINSNALISIKELPKELTIVGGGIIGLEFSAMFNQLGTKITVIEWAKKCLATFDPDVSDAIETELRAQGVTILTNHKVLDIENGIIKVENMNTGKEENIPSPLNLIAIGRKAVVDQAVCERLGIAVDNKGIVINEYLQTSVPSIWAVGDSTGRSILAHVAIQQGLCCAETIMWVPRAIDYTVIPAVVYTLPEVATVGEVPADLTGVDVVTTPMSQNLRAAIEEHEVGFVKLWLRGHELVACQIVGDYAGEIIQSYATIIENKLDITAVAQTIHAHPSYTEIVRTSLENALGKGFYK